MKKIDLKRELKLLYQPPAREVVRVDVPTMKFLMVDGEGDPNGSQQFKDAVEVLYSVSYALKFMVKKGSEAIDYGVMPLEGLWWADDMATFTAEDKSKWKWTLMIMQPRYVTPELVDSAIAEARKKKNLVALQKVRFEAFSEGTAAQAMHIGPFSEEGPTIQRMQTIRKAPRDIPERYQKSRSQKMEDRRQATDDLTTFCAALAGVPPDSLFEIDQLDLEHEKGVRGYGARVPSLPVPELGRDDEGSFFAFLHREEGFVPPLDHRSDLEACRGSPRD